MLKKFAAVAAAVSAIAVGGIAGLASPASASVAGATCSKSGYHADGNVLYSTSGSQTYVSAYEWSIYGVPGSTQNDVSVVLRKDVVGTDGTLHGYASGTEKYGYNYTDVRKYYAASLKLYGTFTFVFDVNNATDPVCSDETPRF